MKISEMQKIYADIDDFVRCVRAFAITNIDSHPEFFEEYRKHADAMAEARGTLSAYIAIQTNEEEIYG
jgi:hypothetical protein